MGKLIRFSSEDAGKDELMLVSAGRVRRPEIYIDVDALWRIKTGRVDGSDGIEALLKDRDEEL
jgi:hypothetical protein